MDFPDSASTRDDSESNIDESMDSAEVMDVGVSTPPSIPVNPSAAAGATAALYDRDVEPPGNVALVCNGVTVVGDGPPFGGPSFSPFLVAIRP